VGHVGARVNWERAGAGSGSEGCTRSVGAGLVGLVRWLTELGDGPIGPSPSVIYRYIYTHTLQLPQKTKKQKK
jgi:hypothetical protein